MTTPNDKQDVKSVPFRITPEMAYELESNFAACTPPSEVHAANWQTAWGKCLAAAPAPTGEEGGALRPAGSVPTVQAETAVVGWRPMEEAPQDGTVIIAMCRYTTATAGSTSFVSFMAGAWREPGRTVGEPMVCWAWMPRDVLGDWPSEPFPRRVTLQATGLMIPGQNENCKLGGYEPQANEQNLPTGEVREAVARLRKMKPTNRLWSQQHADLQIVLEALASLPVGKGMGALRPSAFVPTEQAEQPVVAVLPDDLLSLSEAATQGEWKTDQGSEARYETQAEVMIYADADCDLHPVADFSCNHTCRLDGDQEANAKLAAASVNFIRTLAAQQAATSTDTQVGIGVFADEQKPNPTGAA